MALTKIDTSMIGEDFSSLALSNASTAFGSGSAITPDLTLNNYFTWTFNEDKTLNLPATNPGVGVWYILATQNSTGGYTLTLDSAYNPVGTTTFDTTADISTLITISSNGSRYDIWYQSFAVAPPYEITNSVMMNGTDEYLIKSMASSGDRNTWTHSCWIKPAINGSNIVLLSGYQAGSGHWGRIQILSGGAIEIEYVVSSSTQWQITTTELLRDPSAWYHVHIIYDTDEAVQDDRVKLYINGEFIANNYTVGSGPGSAAHMWIDDSGRDQAIGVTNNGSLNNYWDGYMAEVIHIDGSAVAPTVLGEYDVNGVWIPKDPSKESITWGTHGFWFDFETSGNLGSDVSGNGFNYTATNIDATNQTVDTPSHNYATWNPLYEMGGGSPAVSTTTYSIANTRVSMPNGHKAHSTISVSSGKWYWEVSYIAKSSLATSTVGWANNNAIGGFNGSSGYANYWGIEASSGTFYDEASAGSTYVTFDVGDTLGIALDLDNDAVWYHKNGTWMNSATIGEIEAGTTTNAVATGFFAGQTEVHPSINGHSGVDNVWDINSGQLGFSYIPPSGFKALHTGNLPATTIVDPSAYFQVELYTGNDPTGQTITFTGNSDLQPDLTILKNRANADEWKVVDSIRGATKELNIDSTNAESTDAQGITAFTTDGFTLGTTTDDGYNATGETFVSYSWKEGATPGFGINSGVSHTAATPTNIAHGLGAVPEFAWVKATSTTGGWYVYHKDMTSQTNNHLWLDQDLAEQSLTDTWGVHTTTNLIIDAIPTATYVAYSWVGIEGFSKFGAFIPNADDDGPFIYTGFKPALILHKSLTNVGSSTQWQATDSARSQYNVTNLPLWPAAAAAESTQNEWDILSNGFKHRRGAGFTSGEKHIYAAWAETPFGGEGVSAGTAR